MLTDTVLVFELPITDRTFTGSLEPGSDEDLLLADLSEKAKQIAPLFSLAMIDRLHQLAGFQLGQQWRKPGLPEHIQAWFLDIFRSGRVRQPDCQGNSLILPMNILISGIDIILAYGHRVTREASDPERTEKAFHKALALKIMHEQLQSQADEVSHYFEMMLLD